MRCETQLYSVFSGLAYGDGLDDIKMNSLLREAHQRFPSDSAARTMRYRYIEATGFGIAAAIAQICCLGDAVSNTKAMANKAAKFGNSSWKSERARRDFLRSQALSTVHLKHLGVAAGDGLRLFERALVDAKHEMKRRAKKNDQVIHRDEIVQFHAAELVRLAMLEYHVPFLQVR